MADYTSHEAPAHEVAALPVMVPQKLIGRDAVLGQVYTRLRENKPVLLYGAAGIGKTALAATLAAAYTEQAGGVLWFNVDGDTIDQLIVHVGRAYHVAEIANGEHPMGMVGAVASTLTRHKPLIVFDGHLNEEVTQVFIERCADKLPVLLVSAHEFGADVWTTIKLEALEAAHASALIKHAAGLPADPDPEIDRLAQTLRNIPMALVLAGATLRSAKQTPAQYLTALNAIPGSANADPSLVALTAAFRSLNSALQGLLIMMGAMFQGEASAELLSKVGNAPQATIEQAMRLLAHQHLVELTQRYGAPYYRLHALTHKFTLTLAGEQRLADLQGKISEALLNYAQQYSTNPDEAAYDRLAAMIDSFLAVAQWAVDNKNLDVPNRLANALMQADDFVSERGYVYELLRLRRLAATSTTAFPASDLSPRTQLVPLMTPPPPGIDIDDEEVEFEDDEDFDDEDIEEDEEDYPATQIGGLDDEDEIDEDEELDEGEEDEEIKPPAFLTELFSDDEDDDDLAYDEEDDEEIIHTYIPEVPVADDRIPEGDIPALRAALMSARQSGNQTRQIALLRALGKAQVDQKLDNEAIATYNEVVSLYDDDDDGAELLDTLDTLAALMVKTENAQPAILHANRGIQLAQRLGDDDTRMHLYITLGDARQLLGESELAETAYGQALEIARNTGDEQNEAIILYKLGYAQLDNSDPEGASANWEQALNLFREQGKRDYEGKVLGGLGTAYGEQARWSEAVRFHTSALYIAREVGDQSEESLQLSNLAYAAVQAQDLAQAVLRYRQALHLAYQNEDRETIVSTIVDLAGLLVKSPRHLAIAQLLIDDAARLEPHDRDVNNLKTRITGELAMHQAQGVEQKPVNGTARDYAANAYALL
jgi:tetratricopeptide (TPR) repeat protein/energy-coupling factor transporter ATP-binding protein EcfA2